MTALVTLWYLSLALCVLAVLAVLALLAARVAAGRFTGRREDARRRLLPVMLGGDPDHLQRLHGTDLAVAADLAGELAEMTRGSERDALLARAAALGVTDLLLCRLRSWSPQARLHAVEALAQFPGGHDYSLVALDDRNPDVRLGAALALAQCGTSPDPLTVVSKLKAGEEEHSLLLVSLMRDLADADSEAVASLMFDENLSHRVKFAALEALSDRGGEYAPLLAYMVRETAQHPEWQPRLFRALGRTGHPAGAEAIVAGLHDANWIVRSAAAEAAGRARLAQAADRLAEMLCDDHFWVRYRVSEALLRLGPRGIATLRAASESRDPVVSAAASKMLAEGKAA
ncbi:HEAT repeat domain-containing protein [Croceicoccus marinus]|uniref:HEAT repeat domain-containing protein n=1 Tax=Croceicoccus marinus TaxID=450378 RepID=A0A7G6VW49_9SPHN|nr:HEAT repeat domain-containing protein [Croceicoccus marinus]QNE05964.1 HEAT repeat domain-containing protein [Croceicoccus marinus]